MLDNLLSCAIVFLGNFLLVLPILFLMRRKPESNLLLQTESVGKWLLYLTSIFYIVYFLIMDLQYLATFQFFLGNAFDPSTPPWIFSIMLVLAAVYGAFKGLEALGRTSVIIFLIILLGILFIGILLFSDLQDSNFTPLLYDGPKQMLLGSLFFLSGSSSIPIFGILFPSVRGKRALGFCFWNTITYAFTGFLIFVIVGTLGNFANLQLFPLYSAATMANLGTFQRMDSVFIGLWLIGIFIKLALDLYIITLCVNQITGKRTAVFTKPLSGLVICVGAVLIAQDKTLLNLFLNPVFLFPLTITAALLLPLTALIGNLIKDRRKQRHEQ